MNPNPFDKLADRISAALPQDANLLREDLNRAVRLAVSSGLSRLDLVTREEFDVQAELLAETRARVELLEQRVRALEEAGAAPEGGQAP